LVFFQSGSEKVAYIINNDQWVFKWPAWLKIKTLVEDIDGKKCHSELLFAGVLDSRSWIQENYTFQHIDISIFSFSLMHQIEN